MVPNLDRLRAKAQHLTESPCPKPAALQSPTASASRYLQQLCKHWSHKFEVSFDPAHGVIPFGNGATATLDAATDALTVRIEAEDGEQLARMQRVVAEHLDRFAFREAPLPFEWR